MSEYNTTVTDMQGKNVDVTVEYYYSPPCAGHRDKYGAPEEPDEDESVEICSIQDIHGNEVELSGIVLARLEEKCLEHAIDRIQDARAERYETRD